MMSNSGYDALFTIETPFEQALSCSVMSALMDVPQNIDRWLNDAHGWMRVMGL
jgi:hypothetical protein